MKYYNKHKKLSYWAKVNMTEVAADLFHDDELIMKDYDWQITKKIQKQMGIIRFLRVNPGVYTVGGRICGGNI